MKKIQVKIEQRYVISVDGMEFPGRFHECSEMAGMKLLKDEKGRSIVLDFPPDSRLNAELASIIEEASEPFDATLIKASPAMLAELKEMAKQEEATNERGTDANEEHDSEHRDGNSHSDTDASVGNTSGSEHNESPAAPKRGPDLGPSSIRRGGIDNSNPDVDKNL